MREAFLNDPADVQWLKETALKGVSLPASWAGFASFVLQGNEDAPHAVNLYQSADPLYTDNFYRVRFDGDGLTYAQACEYSGSDNRPLSGLADGVNNAQV